MRSANRRRIKYNLLSLIKGREATLGRKENEILNGTLADYIKVMEDVELGGDYSIEDKYIYVRLLTDSGKNSIVTDDVRVILSEFSKRDKKKVEKWKTVHTLILIGRYPIHASAKSTLADKINTIGVSCQFFLFHELCYNPLQHFYQPKYSKVTDEEEKDLRNQGYLFARAPTIRYADLIDEKDDKKNSFCDPIVKFAGWNSMTNVREEGKNFALNCMFPEYMIYKAVRRR